MFKDYLQFGLFFFVLHLFISLVLFFFNQAKQSFSSQVLITNTHKYTHIGDN